MNKIFFDFLKSYEITTEPIIRIIKPKKNVLLSTTLPDPACMTWVDRKEKKKPIATRIMPKVSFIVLIMLSNIDKRKV